MHYTAMEYGKEFFKNYGLLRKNLTIVDVGAQDLGGSLRKYAPVGATYIGIDFTPGKSVNIVLEDAYNFPLPDNFADMVVSSSCYEHSQFFWLTFLESMRILKDDGLLYINAPSNGEYHRFPTDNWRFYPDAGQALSDYARYSKGYNTVVLESFIGSKDEIGKWNDFVSVFIKDKDYSHMYSNRIYKNLAKKLEPTNIWSHELATIKNFNDKFWLTGQNIKESFKNNYLFDFASSGNCKVVKALIDDGFDVTRYEPGYSPLYIAAQNGNTKCVEELVRTDININELSVYGLTALYASVGNRHYDITKILLKNGANTEIIHTESGASPFYLAVHLKQPVVAAWLLKFGANKDFILNGQRALNIAKQHNQTEIEQMINIGIEEFCKEEQLDIRFLEVCGRIENYVENAFDL